MIEYVVTVSASKEVDSKKDYAMYESFGELNSVKTNIVDALVELDSMMKTMESKHSFNLNYTKRISLKAPDNKIVWYKCDNHPKGTHMSAMIYIKDPEFASMQMVIKDLDSNGNINPKIAFRRVIQKYCPEKRERV